jgi:hypothetical protein
MLVLAVAARLLDNPPAVGLDEFHYVSDLHAIAGDLIH